MILFLALLAFLWAINPREQSQTPNVILVYMDDMGFGDLGRTGAKGYATPYLDEMASNGLFCSDYVSPQAVCTASRAGLLTGCYPNRIGFSGAIDHTAKVGMPAGEETIAELLKEKGYATAMYGKWHLGFQKQFLPLQHGFDEFFGIPYSNDMWPNHPVNKNYYPPLPLYEGNLIIEQNPDQSLFTTRFTERTLEFISRNKKNPFFIYLAHPMPHVPLFVSEKFAGKSERGLFGDVIMELDWSIGQIRERLREEGLEENTVLLVTSDNGPWLTYGDHAGSTGGFREGKGTTFEGGHRVPFIVEWPKTIPAGKVYNKLMAGIDILPTIAEICETKLPEKYIDGVSFAKVWKGDIALSPREEFYYYYRKNSLEAVRYKDWKLVFPHPGRTYEGLVLGKDGKPGQNIENYKHMGGMYNLSQDSGERYNVLFSSDVVYEKLLETAEKARRDLGDDLNKIEPTNTRPIGRIP